MRLTYNYPSWTGLRSRRRMRTFATSGPWLARRSSVELQTSAPLDSPTLKVNDQASDLNRDGNWMREPHRSCRRPATIGIHAKRGRRARAADGRIRDRVSSKDEKPTIEIAKPGRDWQASSIEEVPVRVRAKDDFRVQNVELHYSVNGGEWKTKPLQRAAARK